jgi:16S rRNA (adenine1518-N6/adenine1519-N6)-dimethyltransferase
MGQNFLVEPDVVSRIGDVAGVSALSCVIEIGPGLGILTRELLGRGATVFAVELDRELKAFLDHDLREFTSLTLIERDARYVDFDAMIGDRPYQVVANLPYSTGTVIVRRFLELEHAPETMTVMLQHEVAERMVAEPPHMSLLSLATQLLALPTLAFLVPPEAFQPPPKVESAVVYLRHRDQPLANAATRERLFQLATAAFQRKRKTLANGLAQGIGLPKDEVDALLAQAGIDPMTRPQSVSISQWIALAKAMMP